jgi:class I fructose-bisphosphate aldolase
MAPGGNERAIVVPPGAAGWKDFRMLNHDQAPESAPRLETSSAGLVRRLGRLFDEQTGRSVIVAMDHGATGVPSGFADPRRLLRSIVAAQPDGVILNTGLARRFAPLFGRRDAPALVLGIDNVLHRGPHGQGPADAHWTQISVEEAVKLGADAVKVILIMGRSGASEWADDLSYVARTAEVCRHWEIPLMVEPYLWGEKVPVDPAARAELNADGARIAVELGADVLKLEVGGNLDIFGAIVAASPVPVFVLGGPKRPTQRDTLADVVAAAAAGAVGLTIGRNVWQHPDPPAMTRALRIALGRGNLEAALAELGTEQASMAGVAGL